MADSAPMSDGRVKATPQVHPASQGIAGTSDDKPAAVRAKAGDEVIGRRRDDAVVNRRKRESRCPSGITDRDPAVNNVLPEPCTNLRRIEALTHHRNNALAHTGSLTCAHDGPARRSLMPLSGRPEPLVCAVVEYLSDRCGTGYCCVQPPGGMARQLVRGRAGGQGAQNRPLAHERLVDSRKPAFRSSTVICACLGAGRWAAALRPVWRGHGTVPVVGTSAERRAPGERVSACHHSQLAGLLTHVAAATGRYHAGEIGAYAVAETNPPLSPCRRRTLDILFRPAAGGRMPSSSPASSTA